MKNKLPKIIVVCGPTGSGKTGLAVELCKKFDGEIINADSRQVYRYMDIGTAKGLDKISNFQFPISNKFSMRQFSIDRVPVHLVNLVEPNEKYNVGEFKKDAEDAIADIINRGKVPFIVGGTGLYIDALVENYRLSENSKYEILNFKQIINHKSQITNKSQIQNYKSQKISNIPASSAGRQYLISKNDLKSKNLDELIEILEKLDPEALNVVDLKNRRRVERAIEVCLTTGIPFTKQRTKGERKYEVLKLAPDISLNREKLYEKINKRVEEMINEGLEDEVKNLVEKYGWESEAMTGIGYREWRGHFVGAGLVPAQNEGRPCLAERRAKVSPLQQIADQIKQSTRNYAKRQITWFKRDEEINYIDLKKDEILVKKFLSK